MLDLLRARALHLAFACITLLSLGPTPVVQPLRGQLQAALTALQGGRPQAALPALEAALQIAPELQTVRELAVRVGLQAEQPDRALQHLDLLLESGAGPTDRDCLRLQALLDMRQLQPAAALLDPAGPTCAARADLLQALTQSSLEEDDFQAAERVLTEWVTLVPDSVEAHRQLGTLLATRAPEQALIHLRLAQSLTSSINPELNRLIRTIEDARAAANPAVALTQVGISLSAIGEWELAARALQHALDQDPEFAVAWAYLGLAQDQLGEDGLAALRQALELEPEHPLNSLLLAKHWQMSGSWGPALLALEQAARLAPQDPVIAAELGAAYAASGDLRSAKAAYSKAVELAPDSATFWRLLALFSLEYEIEIASLGLPAARRAAQLAPAEPATVDLLGYCHFLLGDLQLSDRLSWQALQLDPTHAPSHYHRGLLLLALGRADAARLAFQLAHQLDPLGRIGELAERSLANLPR